MATVRIWQANINKRIVARVPMKDGQVVELGDFNLDGVTFPAAEIVLDYYDPAADEGLFPTGNTVDLVNVPGFGDFPVTLINAGNPHVFLSAASLGLQGSELPAELNGDKEFLAKAEAIRAFCSVKMGLAKTTEEATQLRPHTPKLAFFSPPRAYTCSSGRRVHAADIDVTARILSMGKVHHAMTGTGGIGIAVAAEIYGTIVHQAAAGQERNRQLRIGHTSGVMAVGATVIGTGREWQVEKVTMRRSARRLMEGWVLA
jgi:2-methylaconitate cis-trans-isomerase PrpF